MICPNCAKPSDDGVEDCPSCGLVFAKFKARSVDRPVSQPASSGSGMGGIILGIVLCGAAVGGYAVWQGNAKPVAEDSTVSFKADLYRPQIVALEDVLYAAEPPTLNDAETISSQAGRIAGAILAKHRENPKVLQVAEEFSEFSVSVATALEGQQVLGDARQQWRSQWEALRKRRFKAAKWFRAAVP